MVFALAAGAASVCRGLPLGMKPPTVVLESVRVVEVNANEQAFTLTLRVRNPNELPIPLRGLTCELEMNGERIAHGERDLPVTLPGEGEKLIELQAVTSMNKVFEQLGDMVRSGTTAARYRLHGNVSIGERPEPYPFEHSGSVDLKEMLGLEREPPASKPRYI